MENLLLKKNNKNKSIIALIDGEHYPQVTYDAVNNLKKIFPGTFKGIIFLGGTEKLTIGNLKEYFNEDVYVIGDLDSDFNRALKHFMPDIVYDLSDEPVVNYIIRMKIASFCFAHGCSYMGPDFLFSLEPRNILSKKPTISIVGTGKRIGKTTMSSYVSKFFTAEKIKVCIVAMGRGGPREPRLIKGDEIEITPGYLLELSNEGFHASSDYIEDALTSKIPTVGCRRCGGGLGGKIFMSNIEEGIKLAEEIDPDLIIVEGSGASIPDVKTDKNICIIGAFQNWDAIVGYLGIYRIMMADLIILTMCEEPLADSNKIDFLTANIARFNSKARIIKTIFRPEPLSDISGRRVFVALTSLESIGPKIVDHLQKHHNCKVIKISFNLSNREKLYQDLEAADGYDTILTELKAAAVDVLTDYGTRHNKNVIYLNNIPHIIGDEEIFKEELLKLLAKEKVKDER